EGGALCRRHPPVDPREGGVLTGAGPPHDEPVSALPFGRLGRGCPGRRSYAGCLGRAVRKKSAAPHAAPIAECGALFLRGLRGCPASIQAGHAVVGEAVDQGAIFSGGRSMSFSSQSLITWMAPLTTKVLKYLESASFV